MKKPEKAKFDLNVFMRRFIISHDNYWLQYWNMFFGIIVLLSIFDEAWIVAFRGKGRVTPRERIGHLFSGFVLIVGIFVIFFTSYEQPATVRMAESELE